MSFRLKAAPRWVLLACAAASLAACARSQAAPPPDLTPPPQRPYDAKTQLEQGAPPPLRR
ncbi:hypothetical protein [Methylobacterium aerolatum]|uniref:Type IV pilus biogenesis protein CpaD/CtpE n=1 Tax=Methylobacterium aerolatum TaxID=418708 RepID=A0ABU0HZF8_9HYPH|nr:hypothetical protein [Methylobacterium aerolatum]MDQ0446861.1 type IV pilus biogenesis protein CpaD/CtpE [Methylobacterium aerolatum]GJD33826.1 hypothetical protein FMGBMHLM_0721 [Methylobacterium aerolatum]